MTRLLVPADATVSKLTINANKVRQTNPTSLTRNKLTLKLPWQKEMVNITVTIEVDVFTKQSQVVIAWKQGNTPHVIRNKIVLVTFFNRHRLFNRCLSKKARNKLLN